MRRLCDESVIVLWGETSEEPKSLRYHRACLNSL